MGRTYLRLTEDEFWGMAPKTMFCMIAEWFEIEDYRATCQAVVNNGGKLPERSKPHDPEPEYIEVHPDAW